MKPEPVKRKISIHLSVAAYNALPRLKLKGESVSAAVSRILVAEAMRRDINLRRDEGKVSA